MNKALFVGGVILSSGISFYLGTLRSVSEPDITLQQTSNLTTNAPGNCLDEIAGEKNLASLVITKALIQFRDGNANEAFATLETALDLNIIYVHENAADGSKAAGINTVVRDYRMRYPLFPESLQEKGNATLKERNAKAQRILNL